MKKGLENEQDSIEVIEMVDVPFIIKTGGKEYIFPREVVADRTNYFEDELSVFKRIILDKREKASLNYEMYNGSTASKESNDITDTSTTFKVLEEGASTLSKEECENLAQRQLKFIQSLDESLGRISNKTYGICKETGKLIEPYRLAAVPHSPHSIEAKNNQRR
jgi:RNA polymerase-binding transcription factor DksA